MMIRMIVATNGQNVIGKDGGIPWFHKGDLKFFKEKTEGHVVIMGRKTWESLPPKMRPLPNRCNMVLASSCPWQSADKTMNLWWGQSLDSLLGTAKELFPQKDVWIIGGAQVYKAAEPAADEVLISEVPDELDLSQGSYVFWPGLDSSFRLLSRVEHPHSPELKISTWVR